MKRFNWRPMAWIAVVFALTWMVLIYSWRVTYRVPTGQDIALYGVGLPIVLILGFLGLRKGFDLIRGLGKKATAATPAAAGSDPSSLPEASSADEDLHGIVFLLGSAVRLPAGKSNEEVAAIAESEDRVVAHQDFSLGDGTRPFVSTAEYLDPESFDEELLPEGDDVVELDIEQRRALLLAADALDDVLGLPALQPANPAPAATDAPNVRVEVLIPARWESAASTMTGWLTRHLEQSQWNGSVPKVACRLVEQPADALAALDKLQSDFKRAPKAAPVVLLACDSLASQRTISTFEDARKIFGRKQANGRVPGEGACALLLAGELPAGAESRIQVHRLLAGRREVSADLPSLQPADHIRPLLDKALSSTLEEPVELSQCALISDADQRSSRITEITGVADQVWPAAASSARTRHLGLANGESGAALALATVAVAAAHAKKEQTPTLAVTLSDPFARGVLLLTTSDAASPSLEATGS